MKLQLGFENTPYSARYSRQSPLTSTMKRRRPKQLSQAMQNYGQGKTVGQVATELENKYHIVETFYDLEENNIVQGFEEALRDSLKSGMSGGSWDPTWDPSQLENKFKRSLSSRRFDGIIRGVPTRASLGGVSHLRQNPFATRGSRPSFIDTSLYQRSFKVWMEP